MTAYERLRLESLEADKKLLDQYKKEVSDLENGVGIAKCMSKHEISYALKMLKESISNLEQSIVV